MRIPREGTACGLLLLVLFLLTALLPQTIDAQQSATPAPATVSSTPAAVQSYTLPPDKLAKATTLGWIRTLMHFGGAIWGLTMLWLVLATRTAARMEGCFQRLVRWRWLQGLLFLAALRIVLTLADLPLGLIGHAVSLHYGIGVQGWGSWFGDLAKSLGFSLAIMTPLLLLFNWLVRVSPRRYWLWAWVITVPLMVAGAYGEPLTEPFFNQFEPLSQSHPELVAKLEKVAERTGTKIPPERIFLMKAAVKTNALNAYVTGLGSTKRIVVWDTTAGRIPDDEILFIFGHESGHYVLHHIVKGLLLAAIFLLPFYWICAGCAGWAAGRWGKSWGFAELSSRTGFVLLLLVVAVAQFVLEPLDNLTSRYFEHQADVYGQEAIHGVVADPQRTAASAFTHLGEATLDDPNPNPLVEFWTYSHPSLQHRVRFAAHYDPWQPGGKPEFFAK